MYRCIFVEISSLGFLELNYWFQALTVRDLRAIISKAWIGFGVIVLASVSGFLRLLREYGFGLWLQGDLSLFSSAKNSWIIRSRKVMWCLFAVLYTHCLLSVSLRCFNRFSFPV